MSARRGERYTPDEIETIRKMASERRTDDEIARALGRSCVGWVGTVRRREGIPSGQMRPYTVEEDAAIRESVASGRTSKDIAEETGRTLYSVRSRREKELIDTPHRGPRQIAAEGRREAHIQMLRERKAARRAAEMAGRGLSPPAGRELHPA